LAARKLRGIRFPQKYGGREMSWVAEIAATEEVGCLGMALRCAFVMPSIRDVKVPKENMVGKLHGGDRVYGCLPD